MRHKIAFLSFLIFCSTPVWAQGNSPPSFAPAASSASPVLNISKRTHIRVAYDVKDDVWEAGIGKALYYVRGLLEAYKAQGVNEKEVHISVVLHGPTVYWMLNEAAYRRFKNDEFDFNPHEQVLQELLHHGVSVEVCNATLRGKGWNENDLLPGVIRVHDAYTRLIELQQLGYAYIRF